MAKKNKKAKEKSVKNLQGYSFKRAIIKTKQINLYIYFVGLVFNGIFSVITYNLAMSKNDGVMLVVCTIMEIMVAAVLIYGIIKYYRRKIILTNEGLEYIPTFARKKIYLYNEIGFVQLDKMNDENYTIFSKEGKKIASFNNGYEGIEEAIVAFKGNGVEIRDKENGKIDNLILNTRNKIEKNREAEIKHIKRKDRLAQINKEKEMIRKLNIAMWVISILALFLGTRIRSIVWSAELLFIWGLYIYLYPKMVVEVPTKTKDGREFHYEIPYASAIIALLMLYNLPKLNYVNHDEIKFGLIYFLILFAIYMIMLKKRKIREKTSKMFTVTMAILLIIVCTTDHLNNALTFTPENHETVIALEKDTSRSAKGLRRYYADVVIDGKKENASISAAIYNSLENLPEAVVKCNRKSIFGCEYYKIHR